jgi:hypothetical protein
VRNRCIFYRLKEAAKAKPYAIIGLGGGLFSTIFLFFAGFPAFIEGEGES